MEDDASNDKATKKSKTDDFPAREVLCDASSGTTNTSRGRSRTREIGIDSSLSYKRVRDLSALGTRSYAAPELLSGLRRVAYVLNASLHSKSYICNSDEQAPGKQQRPHSLSSTVSDYGMVVDAYSVGSTIRYMVTGVPPQHNDIDEYIASKNFPLKKIIRVLKKSKIAKRYRSSEAVPMDVADLIQALRHRNSHKRATVRSATSHPWISELQVVSADYEPSPMDHGSLIEFLECSNQMCL